MKDCENLVRYDNCWANRPKKNVVCFLPWRGPEKLLLGICANSLVKPKKLCYNDHGVLCVTQGGMVL